MKRPTRRLSVNILYLNSKKYMAVADEIPVIAIGRSYDNVVKIKEKIDGYFKIHPNDFQSINKGYTVWCDHAN
jgi:hypothetical protein